MGRRVKRTQDLGVVRETEGVKKGERRNLLMGG